jgi:hypothetical protein
MVKFYAVLYQAARIYMQTTSENASKAFEVIETNGARAVPTIRTMVKL